MLRGFLKNKRAQNAIEFVVLLGIVSAAVSAMLIYFRRAVNWRLEEIQQEYGPKDAGAPAPALDRGP
jgi:Flp pilus assembly pilin Flp